jgi:hypothetical protein
VSTFLCASPPGARLKQSLIAVGVFALFLAVFIPTYNKMVEGRAYGRTIGQVLTDRKYAEQYLNKNAQLGTTKEVARGDALRVPIQETLRNPVRAALGIGIGNASESALGQQFSGRFNALYEPFLITAFARMMLELGFIGVGLLAMVYWLVFQDCWVVSRQGQGYHAALAGGWAGVTVLMALSLFYSSIESSLPLSFLFWYFSGLVASERARLTVVRESSVRASRAAPAALTTAVRDV